jgi:hypothetical protein
VTISNNEWENNKLHFRSTDQNATQFVRTNSDSVAYDTHDPSSAIAEALVGRLQWTNAGVKEEQECLLGEFGVPAIELVQKSRRQLAVEFHSLLDSIEQNWELETGKCIFCCSFILY